METNENKGPGDTKWNNAQKENPEKELNEGFSGQHISKSYNPSEEPLEKRLKSENETDEFGNHKEVKRARNTDHHAPNTPNVENENADNAAIRNKESLENRDRNYDTQKNRYPNTHPDNHENRGNMKLDE